MRCEKIEFERLLNTRDLGSLVTADGRRIKKNRLIRSGQLINSSEDDKKKLEQLVGTVIDFRTDKERREQPNPELSGVKELHIPVLGSLTAGITREKESDKEAFIRSAGDPKVALEQMISIYRSFPTMSSAAAAYKAFLQILLENEDKAVLWHCTAGKDRSGFASVIIEHILGVSDEDIFEDYLYTNECIKEDVKQLLGQFVSSGSAVSKEAVMLLFTAQKQFLAAAFDEIDKQFGSFDGYLENVLGADSEMRRRLKDKYLEDA